MIVQLEELVVKTPSIAESSNALKADVVAKFNELSTYWASISEELVAEKGKAQAAKSIDDIKTTGTNVSAIVKKFSQGTSKELAALTRLVHNYHDMGYRNHASALVAPDTAKSPLVLVLEKYIEEKQMAVSQAVGSVFEAKAGVRGALVAPSAGSDVVAAAHNLPWYKQTKKTVTTYLKANAWGVVSYDEPKKVKKLTSIMAGAFVASLFSRLPLPRPELHAWVKLVYNMQACGMQGHLGEREPFTHGLHGSSLGHPRQGAHHRLPHQ